MNNEQPRLERDILIDAAAVFAVHDELATELRKAEDRLQALCREYGDCTRRWAYAPYHLRRAVQASGLLV